MAELEAALLAAVDAGQLADSGEWAAAQGVDHLALVGLLKSLIAADMITTEVRRAGVQRAGPQSRLQRVSLDRARTMAAGVSNLPARPAAAHARTSTTRGWH